MNRNDVLSVRRLVTVAGLLAFAFSSTLPCTVTSEASESLNGCMLQRMKTEGDDTTLGQLREKCLSAETVQPDKDEPGAVMGRRGIEDANVLNPLR